MKTTKTTPAGMPQVPATSQLKGITHGEMTEQLTVSADEELEALLDSDEDKIMHLHDSTIVEERQFAIDKRR